MNSILIVSLVVPLLRIDTAAMFPCFCSSNVKLTKGSKDHTLQCWCINKLPYLQSPSSYLRNVIEEASLLRDTGRQSRKSHLPLKPKLPKKEIWVKIFSHNISLSRYEQVSLIRLRFVSYSSIISRNIGNISFKLVDLCCCEQEG